MSGWGVGERLRLHRYPGGHMFNGEQSIPWLVAELGGRGRIAPPAPRIYPS